MDRLTGIEMFIAVAQQGSFSAVARQRGVANSVVSKHVAALESRLGVRLLNRTTRSISLTEAGRAYLETASRLVSELEEAELAVGRSAVEPRGTLRIAAPMSFGFSELATVLAKFAARYPRIKVALSLSDRMVNVTDEGFDVAIRIAEPADSQLVAKKLATSSAVVCASPAYLTRRGRPQVPQDLKSHNCLLFTRLATRGWPFRVGSRPEVIRVTGSFRANNGDALHRAALADLGLAYLPTFIVGRDIEEGRLETVLDDYAAPPYPIFALYSHRRYLSAKVRRLIDYLVDAFSNGLRITMDQPG